MPKWLWQGPGSILESSTVSAGKARPSQASCVLGKTFPQRLSPGRHAHDSCLPRGPPGCMWGKSQLVLRMTNEQPGSHTDPGPWRRPREPLTSSFSPSPASSRAQGAAGGSTCSKEAIMSLLPMREPPGLRTPLFPPHSPGCEAYGRFLASVFLLLCRRGNGDTHRLGDKGWHSGVSASQLASITSPCRTSCL